MEPILLYAKRDLLEPTVDNVAVEANEGIDKLDDERACESGPLVDVDVMYSLKLPCIGALNNR